jgi:c-di-GMP-binding flagellar brake protein YcgR
MVILILQKLKVEDISMDNFIEKRKYKRIELEKKKYIKIVAPYIARFRNKQWDFSNPLSIEWTIVAVKNMSAGGIMFDYYKKCRYYKAELKLGSLLELKIEFIKSKPAISCIGRVVRIEDAHANAMFRIALEFTEIKDLDRELINTTVEAILRRETKEASVLFKKRYLFRRTIENEKYLDEMIGNSRSKVRSIYN